MFNIKKWHLNSSLQFEHVNSLYFENYNNILEDSEAAANNAQKMNKVFH